MKNGKCALYKISCGVCGELLTDFIYDQIGLVCNEVNKVIPVRNKDKMGIIDAEGYEILPVEYDMVSFFKSGGQKSLPTMHEKIMYIDYTNEFYSFISEESIVICKNNKYGISTIRGKIIIPCILEKAEPFKNGYASIKYNNKWAIIDNDLNYIG